jgi:hypothetical protein
LKSTLRLPGGRVRTLDGDPRTGNLRVDWKHEVRTGRAACRLVPIQFGWSFSSDSEKRSTHGIPKPTYTTKVQAGKSVIKITTSQSAAVATNAIGNSLAERPDLFWAVLFPRFVCRRRIGIEPVKLTTSTRESAAHIRQYGRVPHFSSAVDADRYDVGHEDGRCVRKSESCGHLDDDVATFFTDDGHRAPVVPTVGFDCDRH